VIIQVKRGCIDPQRTAETSSRHVEHLAEPREKMQSSFDRLLRGLNAKAAIGVQQAAAVEDTKSADVLWPHLIRPKDKPVFCTQPLNSRHVMIMPASSALG
jgi:hypothetical protein